MCVCEHTFSPLLAIPTGEKKPKNIQRECSIPSFHCCTCQMPCLQFFIVTSSVSLFNRCDIFSLIPFLRIFPRFSLLLFFFMEEKQQLSLPLPLTVLLFSFLPFPIVSICPVLPTSCFSSLLRLETNQCVHMYQKEEHKWNILVAGILLPAVNSVDRDNLL